MASPPSNDDPDDDPDDDDGELELMPVDPDVIASEKARAAKKVEDVITNLNVDELARAASVDDELAVDWQSLRQFRFRTVHLLGLTALAAIFMTLVRLVDRGLAVVILFLCALAAGWGWVIFRERKLVRLREARRKELLAKGFGTAFAAREAAKVEAEPGQIPRPLANFRFAFSVKQMLVTTAVVAVVLALLRAMGPERLSLVLGLVAVAGFVVYLLGFEVAPILVLAWWLLLALYVIVGFLTAAFTGRDQASVIREIPAAASEFVRHA